MNLINYLLSNIFLILYIPCFIKEYYSFNRFIKGLLSQLICKKINIVLLILYFVLSIVNLMFNNFIIYILNTLICFYYIITFTKEKIKIHARGIRLMIVSFIINLLLIFIDYYVSSIFIFIYPIFVLLIANIFLFPIESYIRNKYIKNARNRIDKASPIIIGISGSFGKTTFKNYLYHILKYKYNVLKSDGNINTLMGLTKWINNNLNSFYDVIIVEMGIDKNHGLKKFKKLFTLDVGVLTSVGKMHLSTFKSYDNIVNSKSEIDLLIKNDGKLFINNKYKDFKKKNYYHDVIYFDDKYNINNINNYQLTLFNGAIEVAKYLNIEEELINLSLKNIPLIKRRFEINKSRNMIVINDSYNSNYYGIVEAIKYMRKYDYYKIVITGGLIEQGKYYKIENYKLGFEMKDIDCLIIITNNKRHPLVNGYKKASFGKVFIIDSYNKINKIIDNIKGKKIILIGAKGSDFYVK